MRKPTPFTSKMTTKALVKALLNGPPLAFSALQLPDVRQVVEEAGEVIKYERESAEEEVRSNRINEIKQLNERERDGYERGYANGHATGHRQGEQDYVDRILADLQRRRGGRTDGL